MVFVNIDGGYIVRAYVLRGQHIVALKHIHAFDIKVVDIFSLVLDLPACINRDAGYAPDDVFYVAVGFCFELVDVVRDRVAKLSDNWGAYGHFAQLVVACVELYVEERIPIVDFQRFSTITHSAELQGETLNRRADGQGESSLIVGARVSKYITFAGDVGLYSYGAEGEIFLIGNLTAQRSLRYSKGSYQGQQHRK